MALLNKKKLALRRKMANNANICIKMFNSFYIILFYVCVNNYNKITFLINLISV